MHDQRFIFFGTVIVSLDLYWINSPSLLVIWIIELMGCSYSLIYLGFEVFFNLIFIILLLVMWIQSFVLIRLVIKSVYCC